MNDITELQVFLKILVPAGTEPETELKLGKNFFLMFNHKKREKDTLIKNHYYCYVSEKKQ